MCLFRFLSFRWHRTEGTTDSGWAYAGIWSLPLFLCHPPSLISVAYFHSRAFEFSSHNPPLAFLKNKHLPFCIIPKPFISPFLLLDTSTHCGTDVIFRYLVERKILNSLSEANQIDVKINPVVLGEGEGTRDWVSASSALQPLHTLYCGLMKKPPGMSWNEPITWMLYCS